MICKLCNGFYLDDDTLFGLFSFSEICLDCQKRFEPKSLYEVIPIDKGLIEYHYLYENINLSKKQEAYLNKHLSIFYIYLAGNSEKYDLYIFLDDDMYHNSSIFGSYLNDFKHVFVFSLMRKELLYKDVF